MTRLINHFFAVIVVLIDKHIKIEYRDEYKPKYRVEMKAISADTRRCLEYDSEEPKESRIFQGKADIQNRIDEFFTNDNNKHNSKQLLKDLSNVIGVKYATEDGASVAVAVLVKVVNQIQSRARTQTQTQAIELIRTEDVMDLSPNKNEDAPDIRVVVGDREFGVIERKSKYVLDILYEKLEDYISKIQQMQYQDLSLSEHIASASLTQGIHYAVDRGLCVLLTELVRYILIYPIYNGSHIERIKFEIGNISDDFNNSSLNLLLNYCKFCFDKFSSVAGMIKDNKIHLFTNLNLQKRLNSLKIKQKQNENARSTGDTQFSPLNSKFKQWKISEIIPDFRLYSLITPNWRERRDVRSIKQELYSDRFINLDYDIISDCLTCNLWILNNLLSNYGLGYTAVATSGLLNNEIRSFKSDWPFKLIYNEFQKEYIGLCGLNVSDFDRHISTQNGIDDVEHVYEQSGVMGIMSIIFTDNERVSHERLIHTNECDPESGQYVTVLIKQAHQDQNSNVWEYLFSLAKTSKTYECQVQSRPLAGEVKENEVTTTMEGTNNSGNTGSTHNSNNNNNNSNNNNSNNDNSNNSTQRERLISLAKRNGWNIILLVSNGRQMDITNYLEESDYSQLQMDIRDYIASNYFDGNSNSLDYYTMVIEHLQSEIESGRDGGDNDDDDDAR